MTPILDGIFREALDKRIFSGASLLVARRREICYQKCWGLTKEGGAHIDFDTRFDLASLTKPLATTVLTLAAASRGALGLDDPLPSFFPSASIPPDKRAITVRQLLGHTSGFPAYHPFYRDLIAVPFSERAEALRSRILEASLLNPPGKTACYSDLGFILLGMILERVLGRSLKESFRAICMRPGGIALSDLHFCPVRTGGDPAEPPEKLYAQGYVFAATELCPWRKRLLEGEVDDENAYCLGGVAGHAGLFGTVHGVYRQLSFLWDVYRGEAGGPECRQDLLRLFWTRQADPGAGSWALGFDTPSPSGSSAGRYFSPRSVGHLGFSGASFWLDPDQEVLVILLTNRIYPSRRNEGIKSFRPLVHDTVMEALR